jgi:DNA-binding MurR/RpiR family transcriptional regulator
MTHDLFVTIKINYNTFTQVEKHIADFILSNAKNVLYMSISELADACGVGDTSVFRFCRHLELTGYQDFKVDLAQTISETQAVPELSNCIVASSDSADVMIRKVLNNNISVLMETYQLIDPITLATVTQWLSQAHRICFFGVGASSTSAMEANSRFLRVCAKSECLTDARMQILRASLMTPQDVAILFSYSGATKETIAIAQAAKNAGAHTVCISRFAHSTLAEICERFFLYGGNEGPLQSGSLSVKCSQLLLMEVLYIAYRQANPKESQRYSEITDTCLKIGKV